MLSREDVFQYGTSRRNVGDRPELFIATRSLEVSAKGQWGLQQMPVALMMNVWDS